MKEGAVPVMNEKKGFFRTRTSGLRCIYTVLLAIILAVTVSCGRTVQEPLFTPFTVAQISGEALWRRISVDSDFRNYGTWTNYTGMKPGQSPHGVWHRVTANRTLLDAIPSVDSTAPPGSIIVKENFDSNKTLLNFTVMAKVENYNKDNGDWFWAMYGPDGDILAEGSLKGCISCHEGMRKNDYIIINPLNQTP
jgi:hypothetical protein